MSMVDDMDDAVRTLGTGEALFHAGDDGGIWQLESGAMRLDLVAGEGPGQLFQIALPGDLLGLEALAACSQQSTARAIVRSTVRRCRFHGDAQRHLALLEGLMQARQRSADLVRLRTGPAPERIRALLVLLASAEAEAGPRVRALPTIRDMAALIDATPETVSRILAQLRRHRILDGRQRQGASYSLARLCQGDWPRGMTRSDGSQPLATAPG
jgi:CRP-like cAMP-binding protein